MRVENGRVGGVEHYFGGALPRGHRGVDVVRRPVGCRWPAPAAGPPAQSVSKAIAVDAASNRAFVYDDDSDALFAINLAQVSRLRRRARLVDLLRPLASVGTVPESIQTPIRLPTENRIMMAGIAVEMPATMFFSITGHE